MHSSQKEVKDYNSCLGKKSRSQRLRDEKHPKTIIFDYESQT